MIDKLQRFFAISVPGFPTGVLVGFAGVFVIGTIGFLAFLGPRRGARWAAGLLLAEYMALILMLTVFCRKLLDVREFHLIPFRSYWYVWEGGRFLVQVCMNVLAFVPIGLLLGCAFGRMKWWKALAIGGEFSLLIEVLQFVFKRGFSEFDDVFHNVLGCAIGFGVYVGVRWLIRQISPLAGARSKWQTLAQIEITKGAPIGRLLQCGWENSQRVVPLKGLSLLSQTRPDGFLRDLQNL